MESLVALMNARLSIINGSSLTLEYSNTGHITGISTRWHVYDLAHTPP